jgi:GWxTD domain-containing protein
MLLPARPDDPSVVGTLGILLALSAPSAEADFRGRLRAAELLERALALDPGNPRFLLAYGLVLEKRGVERDARRVTSRGIAAAAERPGQLTPEELAEAFYRRAVSLETHVQEFEGLRRMPPGAMPLNSPECIGLGAFCLNFTRPATFYDLIVGGGAVVEDLVQDERTALIAEYGRALALVPAHQGANRRLMAMHARAGEWQAVLERARAYRAAAPDRPWASILLGMALVWAGDAEAAEPHFKEGIGELEPADRMVFEDLRPLLPGRREAAWDALDPDGRRRSRLALWERQDPLYLTESSEREQEHYARVALAELLFGEEQTGRRGWESDRGQILVRYGRPDLQWQLYRDDARAPHDADPISGTGVSRGGTGGGRWIFWKYERDEPAFIFEKQLGFSGVRHMSRSVSFAFQQDLKNRAPSRYQPPFTDVGPIPHQVARFRGDADDEHDVVVFAAMPGAAALGGEAAGRVPVDTVERAFFLHREDALGVVARVRQRAEAGAEAFDVRTTVRPGVYRYSVEVASPDHSLAAVERGQVVVGRYSPSPLTLSDLLAGSYAGRPDGAEEPSGWGDVNLRPLRCLRVPDDRSIALVFEIYGLRPEEGLATYRVELTIGEVPATSFTVRLLRGLRDLLDAPAEGSLSYGRVAETDGRRAVEWFQVELGEDLPEEVVLQVRVRDLIAGTEATSSRVVHRDACAPAIVD